MFNFGDKVKDKVNGYFGIISGHAEYQYGEDSYLVEGKDSTGRPIECWVIESRLKYDNYIKGE